MAARRAWPSATRRSVPFSKQLGELLVEDPLVQADLDARGWGSRGAAAGAGGVAAAGCGLQVLRLRPRAASAAAHAAACGCRCSAAAAGAAAARQRRRGAGCGCSRRRGSRPDGDRYRRRRHDDRSGLRDIDVATRERLPGRTRSARTTSRPSSSFANRGAYRMYITIRNNTMATPRTVEQLRHAEHPAAVVLDGGDRRIDRGLRDRSGDR